MTIELIIPNWSAPKNIHCVTTTRKGGYSKHEYQSFNLGEHVKDSAEWVNKNRALLKQELKLPSDPVWLEQVHGTQVLKLDENAPENNTADAAYTNKCGVVCAVLTADCLPIVFCDQQGRHIAASHAGWRGLLKGVIESTLQSLPVTNENLICWLGPAIGPNHFEVGNEVAEQFIEKDAMHENAFEAQKDKKYLANIYQLARNILNKHGVSNIFGGDHCTFSESEMFYSYRRDGETGRMATLIWREPRDGRI